MRKVGDIVKIKEFEKCKISPYTPYFIPEMKKYCGKHLEIAQVLDFKAAKVVWYKVRGSFYTFCEEWFEKDNLNLLKIE